MKTITRQDWVKALRSGEYEQGHGNLRYKDVHGTPHFCCLGVACEIAKLPRFDREDWVIYIDSEYDEDCLSRPKDAYVAKLHIPSAIGDMLNLTTEDENILAALNDEHALSFKDIADIIESGKIEVPAEDEDENGY